MTKCAYKYERKPYTKCGKVYKYIHSLKTDGVWPNGVWPICFKCYYRQFDRFQDKKYTLVLSIKQFKAFEIIK
jgi:hypothetical protein